VQSIHTEQEQLDSENPVFRRLVELLGKDYAVESHVTTTEDGFILKMFRVGKREPQADRPVVLLQHGLLASAETFVVDPNGSWVQVLVDSGFDVWLGNNRGCIYSKGHTQYTIHDFEYYNFSFYEMGKYDVPAIVDYILDKTG